MKDKLRPPALAGAARLQPERLPAAHLHANPLYQHLCPGAPSSWILLWALRAGLHEGLEIHFRPHQPDPRWAGASPCSPLPHPADPRAFDVTELADIGWQAPIGVALPVATSWLLFLASWAWLPRHLFVYLFVAAFLGGALSISVKVICQRPADGDERHLPLAHHRRRLPLHLARLLLFPRPCSTARP